LALLAVPAWRFARREGGYHEDRRHATWNAGGTRPCCKRAVPCHDAERHRVWRV